MRKYKKVAISIITSLMIILNLFCFTFAEELPANEPQTGTGQFTVHFDNMPADLTYTVIFTAVNKDTGEQYYTNLYCTNDYTAKLKVPAGNYVVGGSVDGDMVSTFRIYSDHKDGEYEIDDNVVCGVSLNFDNETMAELGYDISSEVKDDTTDTSVDTDLTEDVAETNAEKEDITDNVKENDSQTEQKNDKEVDNNSSVLLNALKRNIIFIVIIAVCGLSLFIIKKKKEKNN